ncbi:MAG: hypothetical protein V4739_10270 [Pseudomonadota bacterium]
MSDTDTTVSSDPVTAAPEGATATTTTAQAEQLRRSHTVMLEAVYRSLQSSLPAELFNVTVNTAQEVASYQTSASDTAPRTTVYRATDPQRYQALVDRAAVLGHAGVADGPQAVMPAQVHSVYLTDHSAMYQDANDQWHWVGRTANPALYAGIVALDLALPPPAIAPVPDDLTGPGRELVWLQDSLDYAPTLPTEFDVFAEFGLGGVTPEQARYFNEMIAQSPSLVAQLREAKAQGIAMQWRHDLPSDAAYEPGSRTIYLSEVMNRADWDRLPPAHRLTYAANFVNGLSHELGHARDSNGARPSPASFRNETAFRAAYLRYMAQCESAAYLNTMRVADELESHSGLSLFMNSWQDAQGYTGSVYEDIYRDPTLTPTERLQRLAKIARQEHHGFAADGYYQKMAHALWQQYRAQQRDGL